MMIRIYSKILIYSLLILVFVSCKSSDRILLQHPGNELTTDDNRAAKLLNEYLHKDNVLVVLHRAGWRYAPENSIAAIRQAIKIGVDVIEIDIGVTKDGEVILMHDKTLDRTTSGKGPVSDYTLEEIKQLKLRDGGGHIVNYRVATLREALLEAKDKVLINLDKSFKHFDKVLPVLKETGTIDQVIVKGYNIPLSHVKKVFGTYHDSINYMPIIKLGSKGYQDLFEEALMESIDGVEFTFESDTIPEVHRFSEFNHLGIRVWVNSLWPEHNAGHDDDKAFFYEPDLAYGWLIHQGVNMIQTDRPELLLEYLRSKGLHN